MIGWREGIGTEIEWKSWCRLKVFQMVDRVGLQGERAQRELMKTMQLGWSIKEAQENTSNFLQLLLPLVAQLECLGGPESARGVCSLFPFLQSWPTDGENRYDVRQLLFHLDHGFDWAGYLISPTFGEAINTFPSSFTVRMLKEHLEKSEKYLRANRVKWFYLLLITNPRSPIFPQIHKSSRTISKFVHSYTRSLFHMMSRELRWNIIKFTPGTC